MPLSDDTDLRLGGPGVPRWSARNISQSWEPDYPSNLQRDVNGNLIDLTPAKLRKLRTTISGDDVTPPAFETLYRGLQTTVDWIAFVGIVGTISTGSMTVTIDRTPRTTAGNSFATSETGEQVESGAISFVDNGDGTWDATVTYSTTSSGQGALYYRPSLTMVVEGWSADDEEWRAARSWELILREV